MFQPASTNSTDNTPNRSTKSTSTTTAGNANFKRLSNGHFSSDCSQNLIQRALGPPLRLSRPVSIYLTDFTPNRSTKSSSTTTAENVNFKQLLNGHFSSYRSQNRIQCASGPPLRVSRLALINLTDNTPDRSTKGAASTSVDDAKLQLLSRPQISMDNRQNHPIAPSGHQLT